MDFPEGGKLQNLIRAKTMKKGGVGYVQPGPTSFPTSPSAPRRCCG